MKKCLFFIFFILFATTAQAGSTVWIKGGKSFLNLNECSYDANRKDCSDFETEKEFFFQMSPVNIRQKISSMEKLGYRIEPWIGYSQANFSKTKKFQRFRRDTVIDTNVTIKNIQFGANLFLDYTIFDNLEIYGGPMIGFELNQVSGEISNVGRTNIGTGQDADVDLREIINTKYDTNFFYGAEVGGEYEIIDNLAIGAFAGMIFHNRANHAEFGYSNDLNNELRAGASLTFYLE